MSVVSHDVSDLAASADALQELPIRATSEMEDSREKDAQIMGDLDLVVGSGTVEKISGSGGVVVVGGQGGVNTEPSDSESAT